MVLFLVIALLDFSLNPAMYFKYCFQELQNVRNGLIIVILDGCPLVGKYVTIRKKVSLRWFRAS